MTVALLLHRADGAPLSTSFRRAAFGTADPFARYREIAWEGPGAMSAGRVSFVGELDVARFPHTETIVVVEGELTLTAAGAAPLVLGRGEGAVIARGTALRILAHRARYSCSARPRPRNRTSAGITPLRADADFKPSNSAAGRDAAGPHPAMPQRQRVHRRAARSTTPAPGTRRLTTASSARIASTSSWSCWPAACASPAPMAACCRPTPAMRCSCRRARRSAGKAAIAWRSSTSCQSVPA